MIPAKRRGAYWKKAATVHSRQLEPWLKRFWINALAFILFMPTHILLQTGYYEQLMRITGIRALTQTIWLSLFKVSVVSLCGTGVAAASLRTVKSTGCTVGESAAYRFIGRVPGLSFAVMFRIVFWGTLLPWIALYCPHFIHLLFR